MLLLPLVVSVVPSFVVPPASADTDLLKLVPRDSFFVVQCAPLDTLRADARANAWWQFATDPAFAPLWKQFDELHENVVHDLEGFDPRVLFDAIHGPVALYVSAPGKLDDAVIGLLVSPGGDTQTFDKLFGQVRDHAAADSTLQRVTQDGVEYDLLVEKPSSSETTHELHPDVVAFLRCNGIAAMLVDHDEVRARTAAGALIQRIRGTSSDANFASHPGLLEARGRTGGPARAELFLDLGPVSREIGADAEAGSSEQRMLTELGLNDMRWVHARCDFAAGENLDVEIAAKLSETGALTAWLGSLHAPSAKWIAHVPKDASALGFVGVDVHGLWNEVWATFGRVEKEQTAQFRAQLDMGAQAMGALDIERDLIGQFSGEFAQFSLAVPNEEAQAVLRTQLGAAPNAAALAERLPAVGEVYLVGVRDPRALEGTLESLFGMVGLGESIDSDVLDGNEIYYAEIADGVRFSWWFGSDCVALSLYPTALRKAIAHLGTDAAPSAATDPRFAKILADNSDACALSVCSTPEMLKAAGHAASMLATFGDDEDGLDLSGLDWQGLVDRYLKGTTVCTLRRQGGEMRMHFRTR